MTNTTTKKFTARQLTKAGFTRVPEMDFRDDGTTFKMFKYAGVYVTYATYDNGVDEREIFLDVDVDRKREKHFTYSDVKECNWRDLCGEFNGVPESQVNVEKLALNCEIISKGIEELENKVLNEKVDAEKLQHLRDEEVTQVLEAIEYYKANFNWFDSSDFDVRESKREIGRALSYIKHVNTHPIQDMEFKEQRSLDQRVARGEWVDGFLNGYRNSILRYVAKSNKEEN